jgi:hypothetical protein
MICVRAGQRSFPPVERVIVSHVPTSADRSPQAGKAVAVVAGFALPAWLISVVLHAGLLGTLATLTWTVTSRLPEQQFTVGIMVKKDTSQGQAFESQDTTFTERRDEATDVLKFLPDAEPTAVADSLPPLPEVDLSSIGISGSMIKESGDVLAVPDSGGVSGAMVNTQFFGAQVWGSKFVYVIDRSGSMSQRDRLGAAKRELMGSLSKLPPESQFQVIFYNLQPAIMKSGGVVNRLMYATDGNKTLATRFLEGITPDSGTEHLPALKMALSLKPDVIFFLTDADDLRERDVKEATDLNKDQARIHTIEFGIGAEVDRKNQLRELADKNGGTYRYIDAAKLDRRGEESNR